MSTALVVFLKVISGFWFELYYGIVLCDYHYRDGNFIIAAITAIMVIITIMTALVEYLVCFAI